MHRKIMLGALVAGGLLVGSAPEALACGGCFQVPTETGTVITDHRMIFSVSPTQTTLYDEIEYQGSPSSFAWVLPIRGTVKVGVSSDSLFAALDQLTQTTIVAPPFPSCPQPDNCACAFGPSANAAAGDDSTVPSVTVLAQAVVGPYETVQLRSTDANALDAWLAANNFAVPAGVQPIIASYVAEGFDFLAMRLVPGQSVKAMRPVSVTYPGAGLSLPLRMVAAGTGATVGITLWVVGNGRWQPSNFQLFTIAPGDIVWDWTTSSSNYTTVRAQKEAALNNWAWQIESSIALAPYDIENALLGAPSDYLPVAASDAGVAESADSVRQDDLSRLMPGGNQASLRVTRMRADLAHAALVNDLVLAGSDDQSELSNRYQVTQSVHAPTCPSPPVCACGGFGSSGSNSGSSGSYGASGSSSGSPSDTPPVAGAKAAPARGGATSSCAATPAGGSGAGGLGAGFALATLAGAAFVRTRSRAKKHRSGDATGRAAEG